MSQVTHRPRAACCRLLWSHSDPRDSDEAPAPGEGTCLGSGWGFTCSHIRKRPPGHTPYQVGPHVWAAEKAAQVSCLPGSQSMPSTVLRRHCVREAGAWSQHPCVLSVGGLRVWTGWPFSSPGPHIPATRRLLHTWRHCRDLPASSSRAHPTMGTSVLTSQVLLSCFHCFPQKFASRQCWLKLVQPFYFYF